MRMDGCGMVGCEVKEVQPLVPPVAVDDNHSCSSLSGRGQPCGMHSIVLTQISVQPYLAGAGWHHALT